MKDRNDKKRHRSCAGFTIIELMLVVVILGVLAAVVAGQFKGRGKKARINATRASISAIGTAIDLYEVDTGRYPPSLQSLVSNDGSQNWLGPYIRGGVPVDAWGTTFGYTQQGDSGYKITSAGPDLQMGGSDDITSF